MNEEAGWLWFAGIMMIIMGSFNAVEGSGAVWVRLTAVLLAVVNSVTQLAFVPVHPAWSTMVIALCVVVIWAVVVPGAQLWKTYGTNRSTSR